MMVLDRQSPLPLWAQLLDDLRARIAAREFEERFPTDEELVREYGVSRQTARQAVGELERSGTVERQRGRGSFLRRPTSLEQSLVGFYSLAHSITAGGLDERSVVLRKERVVDNGAAEKLGLAEGAETVVVERLRLAGDEPLALDRSWLPVDVGEALDAGEIERGSLYESIAAHTGIRVTGGNERIMAGLADARTRKLLALPRNEAVLQVERVATSGGRAIEYRRSAIRGDRFSFIADWEAR